MTFISYAQNHEDVMLWRALSHIKNGFYVDVGANHPSDDSVTKAFYERGWSGINIEPLAKHIEQLQAERTRDINLQLAVGAVDGEVELFDTSVRGLATASAAVAGIHRLAGLEVVKSTVPMRTLAGIFAEYVSGEVHFLKIDVEGFEQDVLQGMDFFLFRPWIVVVEATLPNSQQIDANWEPTLLAAGYRRVFFDGLNRYYTAPEHHEALAAAFASPANVFDDYMSAETHRLAQCLVTTEIRAELLAEQLAQEKAQLRETQSLAQAQLQEVQSQTQVALDQLQQAERMLVLLYASSSWRLTAPLRGVSLQVQQTLAKVRSAIVVGGKKVAVALENHPTLRRLGGRLARALGLHQQALALHFSLRSGHPPALKRQNLHADADASSYFNPVVLPNRPVQPEMMSPMAATQGDSADFWFRFTGHAEGHYSLAIVNRGLTVALDELSHQQVVFVPYHGTLQTGQQHFPGPQGMALESMFRRLLPSDATGRTVSIVHHFPLICDAQPARYRFVLFFWEETAVPSAMVNCINSHFDAVLVATEFVRRALRNSGCRLPVFVIPIGIDHLVSPKTPPLLELMPKANTAFRFLHVSSVFERKGADVLLRAFADEFSAQDDVELYIKTFANPHNQVRAQWEALTHGRSDAPMIFIDEAPLSDAGMLELYRSAQALVLPTRGEGFNLPAAEALALGLPVIVTGYGAHIDFCTRSTALLVPFGFSRSASHVKSADACWVEPDVKGLRDQMRQIRTEVLSQDNTLAQRRQAGMAHVRQTYTWTQSAKAVLASVKWLNGGGANKKPRQMALLSPWKTRCGIAEYSHNLLGGFDAFDELQVYCDTRTKPDSGQSIYHVGWKLGNNASVCEVLDEISQNQPDVLLVQHQPSLFHLSHEVCERLAALQAAGSVVVLELHSTLPLLHECRLSGQAAVALRRLDRIIVHKPEDLNHLLALGLVNNVFLLVHGVVQPQTSTRPMASRSAWGIGEDELVLGCFGFILPHKGIDTLIESLRPLAQVTQRRVRLLGLNSVLDVRSEATLVSYQKQARALGVDKQITWITDFRPIEECVQLLGMADYVVFPYKDTRESASGAVTIGLASLKPVLVSPLPIFSDVWDCTWKMGGGDIQSIIGAVCQLESDPEQVRQLIARQQAWLAERDWTRISLRLEAVLMGLLLDREVAVSVSAGVQQGLQTQKAGDTGQGQLLVDVSELYFRDAKTGIQRVVRSILSELLANPPPGFRICPVYGTADKGYRYTEKYTEDVLQRPADPPDRVVQVRAGDIFLGLDLSAHLFPGAEAELKRFRLAGARVHFIVYDIIPLLQPHYTVPDISHAFANWMHSLAREADSLICISAAVASDVGSWLNQHAQTPSLPILRHFHLGADIKNSLPSTGIPEDGPALLQKIRDKPSFLMVGTLEPRKGQMQALAAFEQLWGAGMSVNLVIVGKEGWNMQALASMMRVHPAQGQQLFWLENVSDEFLEQVYGAASCLIAASEAEGFGLPLIEAAQHGLPIIARDIPVFHEIARNHAFYFSGLDAKVLARAVSEWLELERTGEAPQSSTMPWLTWQQSTKSLSNILLSE